MPLRWVGAEEFVVEGGRTVYHAYRNHDGNSPYQYLYQTDYSEEPEFEFDVRDLPQWEDGLAHDEVIRQACREGTLRFPEDT